MLSLVRLRDRLFLNNGSERSFQVKKNIFISFLAKGGSIALNLALVPLTIDYVNPMQYGVWLTLSSIIAWFGFFDIGLGNGLRNKLTEAITIGDHKLGRKYVSTTYLVLALISFSLLCIFFLVNSFIDWPKLLNAPVQLAKELSVVSLIVFSIFCFQFVFQLLDVVCFANQKTSITSIINFFGSLLGFIIIYALTRFTEGSLLYLCLSIGISPLVVLLLFSLVLYSRSFKKYAPAFRLANFSYAKDIMGLGFKFFLIQLGLIFFYNSNNIIIAHIIGPEAVTPYNIAFKYFGIITMISVIIMTPLWPAFTAANAKKDFSWIEQTVGKFEKLSLLIFLLGLLMLLVSGKAYEAWVGNKVQVPFYLSVVLCFYTCLNTYRTIFCYYANAVGKIKIQLILIVTSGLINIPLAIFLGKWLGLPGVVLSTTILCVACCIFEVTQYKKLIRNRASGIWNQ
ncbi:MAG TPA: oligosaccharide flippase family protein [Chitinophagaceae bacterium]|nr:oligosaccharide flippase family protein [Chitinophagaceae bacterium]